jgi:hypothetical protein
MFQLPETCSLDLWVVISQFLHQFTFPTQVAHIGYLAYYALKVALDGLANGVELQSQG